MCSSAWRACAAKSSVWNTPCASQPIMPTMNTWRPVAATPFA